ncbi:TPA: hypothetical protein U1W00_000798 [Streptococcus suis]|uniref:hypothetical protein n=1 Tax=Streptococcus suis TaxID=1307 RepID=UPI000415C4F3|nr:hypothetical protein [Streptococcus suis]NQM40193.1 hypothetical protein [Streptococcus suis]HEM3174380.1 hypothetical protein [Streptococcus suis]HEM4055210.1 hypothetical protein [Streptococcus suis]HEM4059089.1 hypothetical protein [Streptococcus suis]HEM6189468.1 hypothetical protein [Streptococcus suis]
MPIEHAERIAQSQVAWAILFIILFFIVVSYLVKTSNRREAKLMDFYDQSKADSKMREERLLAHLDATNTQFSRISDTLVDVQKELVRMNDRMDNFERGE